MADPAIASQLLSGFYAIENNSWRWVARNFSVALKPPPSISAGGHLVVELYLAENEIQKLGPVTLTAAINGTSIGSETFQKAGHYNFTRNLSAQVLDTNILPVQFCFDKSMATVSDRRDLAAVIAGIALLPGQGQ